jgi:hypothetical protein
MFRRANGGSGSPVRCAARTALGAGYYAEYYNFDGFGRLTVDKAAGGAYNEDASTEGVLVVWPAAIYNEHFRPLVVGIRGSLGVNI